MEVRLTTPTQSSNVFRGEITLSEDPADRGPGEEEGAVWVQDGDRLTVNYLDADGNIADSDTITVDAAAPTISDFEPADGTNTSVENPTLQFDATDDGSGFDATTPASHFEVRDGIAVGRRR